MISPKSLSLTALLLGATANAQVYETGGRSEDAFTWIQPEDTVILDQYNSSEPVYPSPRISDATNWKDGLEKARAFVAELTLQEKADMVTGQPGPCVGNIYPIPRLNFTGLCLQDGPASLRTADLVSAFPGGNTIASSWDRKMMYDRSLAMGSEFRAKGAHIALAPSVGPMGRSAYSGRNWEGFSPDPYLSGVAMEESVMGLQDAGVQATAKHWILNEQEILRNPVSFPNGTLQYESISANADDRTVHELYMWPFANAVRANAAAFMCCYQRINGSYGCQNSKALNGLLKTELGFDGYVMSDWYATHSGVASIESGLDLDMPGHFNPKTVINETQSLASYFGGNITTGVNNGTIDVDRLDDMITRIMTPYYALHQDEDYPSVDPSIARLNTFSLPHTWLREWNLEGPERRDVRDNHGELIRKIAAQSTVLLKNEKNALPLKAPKSIAVFGNDAGDNTEGPLNQQQFEFGTLAVGGGSGAALFTYLVSPLAAIKSRAAKDHGQDALVEAYLNNTQVINRDPNGWGAIPLPNDPEVCLVFLKGWASEAVDRESLELDWQGNELVEKVASFCPNTVVVTHSAGINLYPFADNENVTAILAAHYPGQESGNSIVDVLYGDVNPSGHLPYTVAYEAADYNGPIVTNINTTGKDDWQSYFDERLETDYRHFDAQDISPRWEFGFGLSYTTFALSSGLDISPANPDKDEIITSRPPPLATQPGGNPALWQVLYTVRTTVLNTGSVRGHAVPQLYLTFPASTPAGTPPKQLRGFEKLELAAGQRGEVEFDLMRRDLSYWNVEEQSWVIPRGEFEVRVGWSSRDLVVSERLTVVAGEEEKA